MDGKVTSRVTDAAYAKGLISFDVGGGDHPVAFRKIEIKELPGPEEPAVRAERVRTLKALGVAFAAYHEVCTGRRVRRCRRAQAVLRRR